MTEVDTPHPEAGELLVRVASSSVNGFDTATAAGYLQGMMEHRFPLVVGKDFAGTVEAVGEGVAGFTVGDAVFGVVMKPFLGAGSLAEYVTVSAAYGVAHIPDGLGVRDAGALGLAGTAALDILNALDPDKDETILISGATGGVGTLAVQLAAARGARVIATARPGAEADFVTGLTDAEVHVADFTGDLAAQVRALAPNGVDAVLHLAGDHTQLAGAELVIYHASNDGIYSGIWDDGQPKYNLRGRQFTDAEGRYAFTTVTPVPYSNTPSEAVDGMVRVAAALGRSLYRPAHIHYEIHHQDLLKPYRGEVYFAGDPVIPVGVDGPFNTAVFDFVLRTRHSPATATR